MGGRMLAGRWWWASEEAQNMCTLHAVGISELSCNYLVNRPTRSFVRASRGRRSFLLGCRDVPQYKVMKYLQVSFPRPGPLIRMQCEFHRILSSFLCGAGL